MASLGIPRNTIEILQKFNFHFQKKFGQNFLIDTSVLDRIITAAEITKEDVCLEIGPGIGTMTQYLAERAGEVVAVEIDGNLIPILEETLSGYDNVTIINDDILKVDISKIAEQKNGGRPIKVVANLPYYITTPIIMGLFEKQVPLKSITVMVQKEVAERMQTGPGTKDYGALSLAVQYYAEPKVIANVPPNCFMPSKRDRKMTILLTPFMSCTAKLPIYAFFVSAFFPGKGGLIMTGLYLCGIVTGILAALLFKSTLFKGEAVPFVMELPNYRMPGIKNVAQLLWEKAKDFLNKAFTIILLATIVVWFLQSFDLHLNLVTDSSKSLMASVAGWLVPLLTPLGLGDWRIVTSLISGFMAKESVVSTMELLFAGSIQTAMTPASAVTMLIFSLLYTPCIASIAAIRRELGHKWAVGAILWQCAIAWIAAFAARGICLVIGV